MKENTTNIIVRVSKWLTLVVAAILLGHSAHAVVVYDNSHNRQTNELGAPLRFTEGGYEFGDEVVLGGGLTNAYLTNFVFEYYGSGLSGTLTLRVYANNGSQYGTNANGSFFYAPGDLLYDSGAFAVTDGPSGGFGSLLFNQANSGFAVPVPGSFTWTVAYAGAGTFSLALYNSPTVGSDYAQYWEQSGANNSWVYRTSASPSYTTDFGAVADAQTLGTDKAVPSVLTINAPFDKDFRTNSGTVRVGGAVADGKDGPIALVLYKLNSAGYKPATLSSSGVNTNWSAALNLNVWTNKFTVKAIDRAGKVKILPTKTYTFVWTNELKVILSEGSGSAALTPNWTTTNLEVGQTYSMTVVPTKNLLGINTFWYSNTIAKSDSSTNTITVPKFNFRMETNMVLTINSVTNRFIAAAGEYNGLFQAAAVDQNSAGLVTIKANAKRGFSGTAKFAGEKFGFAGTFDLAGKGVGKKPTASKNQPITCDVSLTMDFNGKITGTISNKLNGTVSDLDADKFVWSNDNASTNYSGKYTMVIPSILSGAAGPSGYSYATFTISTNGLITMLGRTADGQKIKQGMKLAQDGYWPLFAQNAINPSKINNGSVFGGLVLTPNTSPDIARVTGNLTWIKAADANYVNGFTNASAARANKYVDNGKLAAVLGLPNLTGFLKLSGGGLGTMTNVPVYEYLYLGNAKAKLPMQTFIAPAKLTSVPYSAKTVALNASGEIKGVFNNPNNGNAVTAFDGVAMQGEFKAYGYFLGPTLGGAYVIENP